MPKPRKWKVRPFSRHELKKWLYRKYRCRCHYCKVLLTYDQSTIDHKRAQARGGTYERRNLVLACKDCNGEKGMMPYYEYVCIWKDRHAAVQQRMLNAVSH